METLTKKTILIEFQGKKYAIPEDATLEDIMTQLEIPKEETVRLHVTKAGFVLMP